MESKPTFLAWVRFISTEWQHEGQDFDDVIAFAIRMAVWAEDGKEIYRSAKSLARQAGCSIRTAKRRRSEAMKLGLFKETGKLDPHGKGIKVLEIAMPADVLVRDEGVSDLAPLVGEESQAVKGTVIGSVNFSDAETSEQVKGEGVSDLAPLLPVLDSDPFAQVEARGVSDLAPNTYSGFATPVISTASPNIPTTSIGIEAQDQEMFEDWPDDCNSGGSQDTLIGRSYASSEQKSYRPSWV